MAMESINIRKKIDSFEILLRNQHSGSEKISFLEGQLNKLNKDFNTFNNSIRLIQNCELFAKEITSLKDKTNNLALQVNILYI